MEPVIVANVPSPQPFQFMKKTFLFRCLALLAVLSLISCSGRKNDEFVGVDSDFDYISGSPLPDRIDGANFFGDNVIKGEFAPVYFGFDRFDVSSGEAAKVRTLAEYMRGVPNSIIIAGFTDERGTAEYNRALGERRALAVRDELISLGINPGRIQTVSFGEEMPADPRSNEEAWALNRRAEFGVIR